MTDLMASNPVTLIVLAVAAWITLALMIRRES